MATDNLSQSATVLTNELRLHDWHRAYMAITFGDSDVDGGYGYLNVKYKANEEKMDYILDRSTFNFAGPTILTLNDYKIWHENNDGPNSGLNADLLDGKHAVEFKDRYGYHHFMHMFIPTTTQKKHFVKIASFTTRKIGAAPDFNKQGTPPYSGAFEYTGNGVTGVTTNDVVVPGGSNIYAEEALRALMVKDQVAGFKANTPYNLDEHDPDLFHTTQMLTNGIYNGTLRGCVSILKSGHPTTFDFHIGLFEDPLCKESDAWKAVNQYFYVSLHDETLPFLNETVADWGTGIFEDLLLNIGVLDGHTNDNTDDMNGETRDSNGHVVDGYNPDYPNKFPSYAWDDVARFTGRNSNVSIVSPSVKPAIRAIMAEHHGSVDSVLASQVSAITAMASTVANSTEEYDKDLDDIMIVAADGGITFKLPDVEVGQDSYSTKGLTSDTKMYYKHARPKMTVDLEKGIYGNYNNVAKTMQDEYPFDANRKRKAFPADNRKDQGDSYQQFIDIMRLYHVASRTDVIDNVSVDTHIFDLYIATDGKAEVRVQPYVSSACILYNFEPCLQEGELPAKKFLRPKSIYDNRYASVKHRHYDYERRIWELSLEIDSIWKDFSNYVAIDQGINNAKKVLMTDIKGKVFAADDNFERHCEPVNERRMGNKVLITKLENVQSNIDGIISEVNACIAESSITTDELAQLEGITENIQNALSKLRKAINYLAERVQACEEAICALALAIKGIGEQLTAMEKKMDDFVKKPGDQMTGSLWMKYDGKTYKDDPAGYEKPESFVGVKFFSGASGAQHGGYLYGATKESHVGLGVERVPGAGAQADWALAVTPDIDKPGGHAMMLNGTRIQFTKNGRGSGGTVSTFNLDFEKLKDWWHTEVAPNGFGELDG